MTDCGILGIFKGNVAGLNHTFAHVDHGVEEALLWVDIRQFLDKSVITLIIDDEKKRVAFLGE